MDGEANKWSQSARMLEKENLPSGDYGQGWVCALGLLGRMVHLPLSALTFVRTSEVNMLMQHVLITANHCLILTLKRVDIETWNTNLKQCP
eukprot:364189-Chlamydomonas_euryale.AAC.13